MAVHVSSQIHDVVQLRNSLRERERVPRPAIEQPAADDGSGPVPPTAALALLSTAITAAHAVMAREAALLLGLDQ